MIRNAEVVGHDPEVQEKYDSMTSRRRELNDELGTVYQEIDNILANLGEMVAAGAKYTKQIDRLATLRLQGEAIEAGILYLTNQREIMRRFNGWLSR